MLAASVLFSPSCKAPVALDASGAPTLDTYSVDEELGLLLRRWRQLLCWRPQRGQGLDSIMKVGCSAVSYREQVCIKVRSDDIYHAMAEVKRWASHCPKSNTIDADMAMMDELQAFFVALTSWSAFISP